MLNVFRTSYVTSTFQSLLYFSLTSFISSILHSSLSPHQVSILSVFHSLLNVRFSRQSGLHVFGFPDLPSFGISISLAVSILQRNFVLLQDLQLVHLEATHRLISSLL